MSYALTRTSMALDRGTLLALKELAKRWQVSKAEVMRRAVKRAKEEAEREAVFPKPLDALNWLQKGGGLSMQEAETFREEVRSERQAKRYWWEE
jgi:hypothetical protein